uniref:Uncharacterized protein n=1 Tax=Nymphaea colorata TaxID=210225 RepID=A0A5K1EZA2_9MAGN|nr:unnamed protein product [Nymphaea colorata]
MVTTTPLNGLKYLEILVNGKSTMAIVNMGVTHNFISNEEMRRLGLTLEKGELCMNAVNSEAKPIDGVARHVVMKIESWPRKANLSMVLMDDF